MLVARGHEPLEEDHHVLVVGERDLDVDRGRLVQVARGVVLLGPEDRADLEDLLEPGAHHHLLVELGRLVQEGLLLEVGDREELGPALGRGRDDLRGRDLDEVVLVQVPRRLVEHGRPDLEDGRDAGPARVEEPDVEPGIELGRHLLGHVERERRLGPREDLERARDELAPARRLLGRLDLAGHHDDRLARDRADGLDDLGRDLLLRDRDLQDPGPVAQEDECEPAEIPDLVDEPDALRASELGGDLCYRRPHRKT